MQLHCVSRWNVHIKRLSLSSFLSVSPSFHMEQLGSHWTDFLEIRYLSIFPKSVVGIIVSLKTDKNNGYFTWRSIHNLVVFHSVIPIILNVSDKSCRENILHISCSITLLLKIVPIMRYCRKIFYSRTNHRWQYGACALHAG